MYYKNHKRHHTLIKLSYILIYARGEVDVLIQDLRIEICGTKIFRTKSRQREIANENMDIPGAEDSPIEHNVLVTKDCGL